MSRNSCVSLCCYNVLMVLKLQENEAIIDQVSRGDVQSSDNKHEQNMIQGSDAADRERKIVFVDDSSERKKCLKPAGKFAGSGLEHSSACLGEKKWGRAATSSSESFGKLQEEMVYLDDIAEFESNLSKDAYLQDQRLFMFNSSLDSKREKLNADNNGLKTQRESQIVKGGSRKIRNASAKKLSRRSVSREISSMMTDIQTAIYYGKSLQNYNDKSRHHMKILVKDNHKSYCADHESIDEPCLFTFIVYKRVDREPSGRCSSKVQIESCCSLDHPCYSCPTNKTATPKAQREKKPAETMSENGNESDGGVASGEESSDSSVSSSAENTGSWKRKQNQPPYVCRAVTMPPERPKDSTVIDSIARSNSFPVQQPDHVHPKLPDYDEISAKFMALKKEKIQSKCHLQNGC